MPPRLVLLGTGTCELDTGSAASAILVELPEVRFVYDFGRGTASRLAQTGLRQDDLEHVLISHYHPDHFSDLIPYLHAALHAPGDPRSRDLHVYGPKGLEEVMQHVSTLSGLAARDNPGAFQVQLHRLETLVRLDSVDVASSELPPAHNRGIRLEHDGRTIAFTGDSHFHAEEVEFLKGVDLAVIDAGHLSDEEIVELAIRSGPGLMICSHLYRPLDPDRLEMTARESGFEGRLVCGHDLMELEL